LLELGDDARGQATAAVRVMRPDPLELGGGDRREPGLVAPLGTRATAGIAGSPDRIGCITVT